MAKQTKIAVFVGSLRKQSFNRQLAVAIEKMVPQGFSFEYADIGGLPLYDQDFDTDYPAAGTALKRLVKQADAVLFVTPEYNRSIPGVLKNAIDIASRPYGDSPFPGKPAAVIGISPGKIGTALAQQHLRNVLAYLDLNTMGQPEAYVQYTDGMFAADGTVTHDSTRKFLQGFVDAFAAHIGGQ